MEHAAEHWYLVYVKPHKETFVIRQLEDRGFGIFFPVLQFDRGYNRGIRIEPYFPHYVFVRADLDSTLARDLRWLAGVRTLVHFGGGPSIVPDAVIELLRERLEPLQHKVLRKSEWLFKPGQRVLVTDGPFAGLEAVFQKGLRGTERVQVLLHVLGSWTRTEINGRDLKPVA